MAQPTEYPKLPKTAVTVELEQGDMRLVVTDTTMARHAFLAMCESVWAAWEKVHELDD